MSDLLVIPLWDESPEQVSDLHERIERLVAAEVVDAVFVADSCGQWREYVGERATHVTCIDTGQHGSQHGKGGNVAAALRSISPENRDRILLLDADVDFSDLDRLRLVLQATTESTPLVKTDFVRSRDPSLTGPELRGGRVTDLVARPLLRNLCPYLASLGQPLSGQVGIHGSALGDLLFLSHYALEIGMLISAARLGTVVEVDVGTIRHRRRPDTHLVHTAQDVVDGFYLATAGLTWSGSRVQALAVR